MNFEANRAASVVANARPSAAELTLGPIRGSRKAYASPDGRPDIRVPFREVVLSDPDEPPVRLYDASGPYTDATATIDLDTGLAALRCAWIAARG